MKILTDHEARYIAGMTPYDRGDLMYGDLEGYPEIDVEHRTVRYHHAHADDKRTMMPDAVFPGSGEPGARTHMYHF